MTDTVLIVDDEESVRRTFREWLTGAMPDARVFAVADSESALQIANEQPVDLAILDWNLGSGSDGLRLLEDLVEFRPDVVAILVTGFAHQATPLDALRMGVRDYIDKNQDLNRDTFVAAIRRQLDRIRPAKQQREINQRLAAFREAVEKVLPIVQTSAAFNDPVPLPAAVKSLLRFVIRGTRAADGALIVRHTALDGTESTVAYGAEGQPLPTPTVPFARSLAASVISFQEPVAINDFDPRALGPLELLPFEANRACILAAPLRVAPDTVVVVELFDKAAPGFTDEDRRLVTSAAEVGTDLLRQAVAERQTHKLLFDAVDAALQATAQLGEASAGPEPGPPPSVLARLKEGLSADSNAIADPDTTLRLVEAVRALAVKHGPSAVNHCVKVVNDLHKLLDELTGL
ncbi:response regulator [Gemmata obscuriglobus]|uniref:Transcriptional regulator n=1 Tax=Gemmata obscuriglobus TaxID=114 RepID=A0A2Z3GYQ5_9BACT|nr:response regulator [Gemmata obscuriglobus]AWM39629.1 transcriptional regulator [Gemmata obscuriglobus]